MNSNGAPTVPLTYLHSGPKRERPKAHMAVFHIRFPVSVVIQKVVRSIFIDRLHCSCEVISLFVP